jgi:hypothetical protein
MYIHKLGDLKFKVLKFYLCAHISACSMVTYMKSVVVHRRNSKLLPKASISLGGFYGWVQWYSACSLHDLSALGGIGQTY